MAIDSPADTLRRPMDVADAPSSSSSAQHRIKLATINNTVPVGVHGLQRTAVLA